MQRRALPVISILTSVSILAAPSSEAAAGEGINALSALAMDDSFDISDLDGLDNADRAAIEFAVV